MSSPCPRHEEMSQKLPGWACEALPDHDMLDVEQHLAACPSCREEADRVKERLSLLDAWADEEPPATLVPATMARIEKDAARPSGNPLSRLFRWLLHGTPDREGLFLGRLPLAWEGTLRLAIVLVFMVGLVGYSFRAMRAFYPEDQQTLVVVQDRLQVDARAGLRLLARTASGAPIQGAQVQIDLQDTHTGRLVSLFTGRTSATGSVDAGFQVPDVPPGTYQLRIRCLSGRGKDDIVRNVELVRTWRMLLSTDKPVYQPGQVIHMRALVLSAASHRAAETGRVTFEVEDAKGNKVFKKLVDVGPFGVAAADFELAQEIHMGDYRLRALLDQDRTERVVVVKKYALPKFKVTFDPLRRVWLPSEKVTGSITGEYFFGKRVTAGRVSIDVSTFDATFHRIAHVEGRTDADGKYAFEIPLPEYFVGQPLAKGQAIVKFDIAMVDGAGHEEKISDILHVAPKRPDEPTTTLNPTQGPGVMPITIDCLPERRQPLPGVENFVYVMTTLPGGTPVSCDVTFAADGGPSTTAQTDAMGIAKFGVTPGKSGPLVVKLTARKAKEASGEQQFTFQPDGGSEGVLARTDKAIYRVGEPMRLSVLSPESRGTIYADLVKDGQTIVTKSLDLVQGRAEMVFDLPQETVGTLRIRAYHIDASGTIHADERTLVVREAGELQIAVKTDRDTYRPGEPSKVSFVVRDGQGKPVQAALGLNVADESVFALAEKHPGLEKVYFALEEELLKPKVEVCKHNTRLDMPEIVGSDRPAYDPQQAARVVLIATTPEPKGLNLLNTWLEKVGLHEAARKEVINELQTLGYIFVLCGLLYFAFKMASSNLARTVLSLAAVLSTVLFWYLCSDGAHTWDAMLASSLAGLLFLLVLYPLVASVRGLFGQTIGGGIVWLVVALASLGWLYSDGAFRWWRIQEMVLAVGMLSALATGITFSCLVVFAAIPRMPAALRPPAVLVVIAVYYALVSTRQPVAGLTFGLLLLAGALLLLVTRLESNPMGTRVPVVAWMLLVLMGFTMIMPNFTRARGGSGPRLESLSPKSQDSLTPTAMPGAPVTFSRESSLPTASARIKTEQERHDQKKPETPAQETDDGIRIRQFFPETLFWNPLILTDASGQAQVEVPGADSITKWRMSATASTRDGMIGSVTAPLRVFQPFFIDPDLPAELTRGDRVQMPVAIYNYLPRPQTLRIDIKSESWFRIEGGTTRTLTLKPNDVTAVSFVLHVDQVGDHRVTVIARSDTVQDAISRPIHVAPDGRETLVTQNGRLEGTARHRVVIPKESVPGGDTILVRLYPGTLTQIIDGLDGMLQMPYGCFEQTSSTTYPNVMILRYLKDTGKSSPQVQMKAERYINIGYQRLLSFEVSGGGFDWFGRPPANKVLTAYGLLEFRDMARVFNVDERIIARTKEWLERQQQADGSFGTESHGIHEGFQDSRNAVQTTAYITWALLEGGPPSEATRRAVAYLGNQVDTVADPYTLALIANVMVLADKQSARTTRVLDRLHGLGRRDGRKMSWSAVRTSMYGSGRGGQVEATALAVQAFSRAGQHLEDVTAGLEFLVASRSPRGAWDSTQATILALRTLVETSARSAGGAGKVQVKIDGKLHDTFTVTPETSDVVLQADLRDAAGKGAHEVELVAEGKVSYLYQVIGKCYMPWTSRPTDQEPGLGIGVAYDRTELTTDDILKATATLRRGADGEGASPMLIADLGIPPGFTVLTGDFDQMKAKGQIARYEVRGRQVIVYIRNLAARTPLVLTWRMKARFPIRARTAPSSVYEYYNPRVRGEAPPLSITVKRGAGR